MLNLVNVQRYSHINYKIIGALVFGVIVLFCSLLIFEKSTSGYVAPVNGDPWTAVSSGSVHTCAISAGEVYCWGGNYHGMLGDGTLNASRTPAPVDTAGVLSGKIVSAVAAGTLHTCVLADGAPYCWGLNSNGELGNGSGDNISTVPVAVDINGELAGKTITSIVASTTYGDHTCVIADGAPYCWGGNSSGQLGDGTTDSSPVPIAVDMSGVLSGKTTTAVVAGYGYTCVVADGAPYCWGNNWSGQLGDGTTNGSQTPVAVDASGQLAGKTVTHISAGYHSCAVADGATYCWGDNGYGQLGDGTTTPSSVPVAVDGVSGLSGKTVVDIDTGSIDSSCAVASQQVYCWGNNERTGKVGHSNPDQESVLLPAEVSLPGKAVASVSNGLEHVCALTVDGGIYCWGDNSYEQAGVDYFMRASIPIKPNYTLLQDKAVTKVSTGYKTTCVIADGQAYCWGSNSVGQLGANLDRQHSFSPVAVDASGVLAGKTITDISASNQHVCAVADGRAYCWGSNMNGQLGIGSTGTGSSVPVAVSNSGALLGRTVTAISAGSQHTCVIADGQAYCWGANGTNRLIGDGTTTQRTSPTAVLRQAGVMADTTVTEISSGRSHTCAIASGQAFCWGRGSDRQLGNGGTTTPTTPVKVTHDVAAIGGKTLASITAGDDFSCVIADLKPYCWGSTAPAFLLADNGLTARSDVPAAVQLSSELEGKQVDAISSRGTGQASPSEKFICISAEGELYCWGNNNFGQLGIGEENVGVNQLTMAKVSQEGVLESKSIAALSVSTEHICAIAENDVYCWGSNYSNELGCDSRRYIYEPFMSQPTSECVLGASTTIPDPGDGGGVTVPGSGDPDDPADDTGTDTLIETGGSVYIAVLAASLLLLSGLIMVVRSYLLPHKR